MADCLGASTELEHCKRRSIDDTLGREQLTTLCSFELCPHRSALRGELNCLGVLAG